MKGFITVLTSIASLTGLGFSGKCFICGFSSDWLVYQDIVHRLYVIILYMCESVTYPERDKDIEWVSGS